MNLLKDTIIDLKANYKSKSAEKIMKLNEITISQTKRSALYSAISEPIMRKRIHVKQSENVLGKKNANDIDELLFQLEQNIWKEVIKVLNISDG